MFLQGFMLYLRNFSCCSRLLCQNVPFIAKLKYFDNLMLHGTTIPVSPILREKCPNTEFFLVHIFPHSYWIRRDTKYLSVFSSNAGKYGQEKTPYLDTFHTVPLRSRSMWFLFTRWAKCSPTITLFASLLQEKSNHKKKSCLSNSTLSLKTQSRL